MTHVLALVGSLRQDSVHRRLAEAAAGLDEPGLTVTVADDLDALPFYNQDHDTAPGHDAVERLRAQIADADALLVLTPTNNGLMSAVLKNAVDWASRPRGASSLDGKPTAVLSASFHPGQVIDSTAHTLAVAGADVLSSQSLELGLLMAQHPRDVDVATEALRAALGALSERAQTTAA